MLFNTPTVAFDEQVENRTKLENALDRVARKTSFETLHAVKVILQSAWQDQEMRVPTLEHPYLRTDQYGDHLPVPIQEVPDDLEIALRMLLDDPENLRLLDGAFRMHFTILICPYQGGIIVRGLLSIPGGE